MNWAMRMRLLGLQDSTLQHRNGLIDAVTLENSVRAVKAPMLQPVERAFWLRSRSTYASEFATFVDRMIAETSPAKPIDLVAQLEADLGQVARVPRSRDVAR